MPLRQAESRTTSGIRTEVAPLCIEEHDSHSGMCVYHEVRATEGPQVGRGVSREVVEPGGREQCCCVRIASCWNMLEAVRLLNEDRVMPENCEFAEASGFKRTDNFGKRRQSRDLEGEAGGSVASAALSVEVCAPA